MKTKICTSIRQSEKLLELGLDKNTCDFKHSWYHDDEYGESGHYEIEIFDDWFYNDIPAWSLSALLNNSLYPVVSQQEDGKWIACSYPRNHVGYCSTPYDDPLDAVFEMICWELENKKL